MQRRPPASERTSTWPSGPGALQGVEGHRVANVDVESTGISRDMRRNKRWNLRDSVEERNPMLLLGRPRGASAAWVGGVLSTGRVGVHGSAAAAVSCRGPFFPFHLGLRFREARKERQDSPTSHLQKQARSWWHGDGDARFRPPPLPFVKAKTPHGHRHDVGAGLHTGEPLDRSPIRLPMSSTLTSINKLTNATCVISWKQQRFGPLS